MPGAGCTSGGFLGAPPHLRQPPTAARDLGIDRVGDVAGEARVAVVRQAALLDEFVQRLGRRDHAAVRLRELDHRHAARRERLRHPGDERGIVGHARDVAAREEGQDMRLHLGERQLPVGDRATVAADRALPDRRLRPQSVALPLADDDRRRVVLGGGVHTHEEGSRLVDLPRAAVARRPVAVVEPLEALRGPLVAVVPLDLRGVAVGDLILEIGPVDGHAIRGVGALEIGFRAVLRGRIGGVPAEMEAAILVLARLDAPPLLVLLAADGLQVEARRGDLEDHRLAARAHTVGEHLPDAAPLGVRELVQLIQDHRVDVFPVVGADRGGDADEPRAGQRGNRDLLLEALDQRGERGRHLGADFGRPEH
jgi:hypothetical protein